MDTDSLFIKSIFLEIKPGKQWKLNIRVTGIVQTWYPIKTLQNILIVFLYNYFLFSIFESISKFLINKSRTCDNLAQITCICAMKGIDFLQN